MTYVCGIYGYQITRVIQIENFEMIITSDQAALKKVYLNFHKYFSM